MTRPRSNIGPALAGAVDLSGLKQRAQKAAPPAGAGGANPRAGRSGVPITEVNFEDEVILRSDEVPVVVVLWSPRSAVCVELVDDLSALEAESDGSWALAPVNVDASPEIAQIFGVQAVPTVVAIAAGQPIASFQGPQPAEQLRLWIDSLLDATAGKLSGPPGGHQEAEADPALVAARSQLDAGEFPAALESYQAVLAEDPSNAEAKGAIRQIAFLTRASAQQPDAIAVADAAPTDIDAAFAAADIEILNQDVEPAFRRLIALVRSTSGDERTRVRTRLIELFELFDPADPEVVAGRRNLANALY